MEAIKDFMQENAILSLSIFCILIGAFILLAAIKDWNIVFGDVNKTTYNLDKIDGQINMFGRKTVRIFSGIGSIFLIMLGALLLILEFA